MNPKEWFKEMGDISDLAVKILLLSSNKIATNEAYSKLLLDLGKHLIKIQECSNQIQRTRSKIQYGNSKIPISKLKVSLEKLSIKKEKLDQKVDVKLNSLSDLYPNFFNDLDSKE